MNNYIRRLTGPERYLLKKINRKGRLGRISYRALIILLAADLTRVYKPEHIAAICQCCIQTVYNTFKRFNEMGIVGLMDATRSGRPRKIPFDVSEEILETIKNKRPNQVEQVKYLHCNWSTKLIKDYIEKVYQIKVCTKTIANYLHENRWTFGRGKHITPPSGPLKKADKDLVLRLLAHPHPDEIILFLDESCFYLVHALAGAWMPCGEALEIVNAGTKAKIWIYGVFEPHSKRFYYRTAPACNSEQTCLFLRQLLQRFPGKTIHIVMDNAKFHTSAETDYFILIDHPQIKAHYLPAHCPILNPIERFWQFVKKIIVANGIYLTLSELYHTLRSFFWHYQQGKVEYNFDLEKLSNLWKNYPAIAT